MSCCLPNDLWIQIIADATLSVGNSIPDQMSNAFAETLDQLLKVKRTKCQTNGGAISLDMNPLQTPDGLRNSSRKSYFHKT